MIRKKGKSWEVSVEAGVAPNGDRRRVWRTAKTKKAAQLLHAQIQQEVAMGVYVPKSDMPLADFLDLWLKDVVQVKVEPKTLENYKSHVERHIKPALGRLILTEITTPVIQRFCTSVLFQQKELAPTSVRVIYQTLRGALNVAINWKLIRENPARGVVLPKNQKTTGQAIRMENLKAVMYAEKPAWLDLCIMIAATTGLRRSEIAALRWRDVDWETSQLHVRKKRIRLAGSVVEGNPKSRRSLRAVPLSEITRHSLLEQRNHQEELKRLLGNRYLGEDLVITSETSRPIDPTWISNEFRRVCRKLDIPVPRLHDLRHTYATQLLNERKLPAHVVSELLGHSSVVVTLGMYGHMTDPARQEAASWWDEVLGVHHSSTKRNDME
jgi:integrase